MVRAHHGNAFEHRHATHEVEAVHVRDAESSFSEQRPQAALEGRRVVHIVCVWDPPYHAARVVGEISRANLLLRDRKHLESSEFLHRADPCRERHPTGGLVDAVEAQHVEIEIPREEPDDIVCPKRGAVVRRVGEAVREEEERPAGHRIPGLVLVRG